MIDNKKIYVTAIILAGGNGSRMCTSSTKQRLILAGESILHRSVRAFCECDIINAIVVVSRYDEIEWARENLCDLPKVCAIVSGGKTRAESAKIGFSVIPDNTEFVAVHDAARCLVTNEIITDVAKMAFIHGAATASTRMVDTVKIISNNGLLSQTLSRDNLALAQTPQIFERSLYERALSLCDVDDSITDDNMMIEKLGASIYPVDTGKENIKITRSEDVSYAEFVLERRAGMGEIRIGHGYDVHRLKEGRRLVIGGVDIPFEKGLDGHSDADVLVHAIMDALLGACALGDIGTHFPNTEERYKGISSLELLRMVDKLIVERGYSVINIDATLIAQRPKFAPYLESIVNNIADILAIERGRINIKATTEEHLGFTGREEGISAHAVVSLQKIRGEF